jgi:hypothetical protein
MKNIVYFLTILLAPCAFGAGLAGTWEGPFSDAQKGYAGFDLQVSGREVTGEAYLSGVGFAYVTDGRVEDNRFSFTVNQVRFEGMIEGNTMSLSSAGRGASGATLQRTMSHVAGPISTQATSGDLEGEWNTHWTGRIGDRPKMIGKIRLDFRTTDDGLKGMAYMGPWPGDCPISDVKIDGGRISFTATGRIPSSSGIPVMRFDGEVHGKELKLTMRHQIFGPDNAVGLPMDAVRASGDTAARP